MMLHSLCTHVVMLTVFSLVSMSPLFHHPLCLRACPLTLLSWPDPSSSLSSSASCPPRSFMLHLAFPQKKVLPACSNSLGVRSPLSGRARLHTTQSLRVWVTSAHSDRPVSSRPSHKKTVGPFASPQNWTVPLPAGRREELRLPTLLTVVPPLGVIIELVALSTSVIGTPPLLVALGSLPPPE